MILLTTDSHILCFIATGIVQIQGLSKIHTSLRALTLKAKYTKGKRDQKKIYFGIKSSDCLQSDPNIWAMCVTQQFSYSWRK